MFDRGCTCCQEEACKGKGSASKYGSLNRLLLGRKWTEHADIAKGSEALLMLLGGKPAGRQEGRIKMSIKYFSLETGRAAKNFHGEKESSCEGAVAYCQEETGAPWQVGMFHRTKRERHCLVCQYASV